MGLGVYRYENPSQRASQAAFNYLYQVKPELANTLQHTTNLDPFHDVLDVTANRTRLKRFFAYVEEHWDD